MSGPAHKQIAAELPTERGQVLPFRCQPTPLKPPTETLAVAITWEALERQLCELAVTQAQRRLAPTLVSATRKQAAFKPMEQVLREVLCIAAVLMDETFHPASDPSIREGEMS